MFIYIFTVETSHTEQGVTATSIEQSINDQEVIQKMVLNNKNSKNNGINQPSKEVHCVEEGFMIENGDTNLVNPITNRNVINN